MACDEDVKKEPLESYFIYLALEKIVFVKKICFLASFSDGDR